MLMPLQRVLLQFCLFAGIAFAGLGALFAAEAACRAVWLPGDTGWTLGHLAKEVFARIAGRLPADAAWCAGGGLAANTLRFADWFLPALGGVVALQFLYERLRHALHRAIWARRGGHALILGEGDDIAGLVGEIRKAGGALVLGRDKVSLDALRRSLWSMPALDVATPPDALGAGKARAVFALSSSDVANLNFVDRLRRAGKPLPPRVALRIESAAIRAAQRANGTGIEEISLDQAMFRHGAALGDPGPLLAAGIRPVTIMLVGAGPRLGELVLHLAAFGYGLEHAPPRFVVVSTAGAAPLPVIERLRAAGGVADVRFIGVDRADAVGLERAYAAALTGKDAIAAIHCIDDVPGEAFAAALVASATLSAMRPGNRPAIIAYGRTGETMPAAELAAGVDFVGADDLATALREKDRRDRVAQAVHEDYLALQRQTRGAEFGKGATERPWSELALAYRDDNRAVADHIDHMLKARGYGRRPAQGGGVSLTRDDIEAMAAMAHARWMAGRMLNGWRHGPERSETQRLHPSLLPYEALADTEKEKDRQQVRNIPHILAILGEEIGHDAAPLGKGNP